MIYTAINIGDPKSETDLDIVGDERFVQWVKQYYEPTSESEHDLYTHYVWEFPVWKTVGAGSYAEYAENYKMVPPIMEVFVPKEGTAFQYLIDYQEELTSIFLGNKTLPIIEKSRSNIWNWEYVHVVYRRLTTTAQLLLKKAHLVSPHKWKIHMEKYRDLKQRAGHSVVDPKQFGEIGRKLFKLHRNEVLKNAKPHPKLNVAKDEFFEDASFKIFDHDTIHQAVALGDEPAYTLMQDGEVWCSKKKWKAMTPEQKLNCLKEEASVLALERAIIPSLFLGEPFRGAKWAYEYALYKICTTITSGWFREYSIEHYWEAVEERPDFVAAFFAGLKQGTIVTLKPEVVKA